MSDPWDPANDPGEADPEITSALRTMAPPAHGYGFWAMVDARLAAEGGAQAPPAPPPPPSAPPEPPGPPPPPLAEVVPLSPRRGPGRWLLAAAAAVVAVAGIAAVTRSDDTKLETTPAAPVVTVETTTPPPPTSVAPPEPTVPSTVPRTASTVPVAPGTSKPSASPTTVRSTPTTRSGGLTLSPAGLGPLRLGMSPQQATATGAVGRYRDADSTAPPGSCGTTPPAGTYRSGDFTALFVDNRLARIYVEPSSRLATPQGITVGSPSSMIASVPGTRSEQPEKYGGGTDIRVVTGGAGYLFTVSQGAITRWSVGTPAGLDLSEACS